MPQRSQSNPPSSVDIDRSLEERLKRFLSTPELVERMIAASEAGRPAAEAVAEALDATFHDEFRNKATYVPIRQRTGILIRDVLRAHAYDVVERGVACHANPLFKQAAVYKRKHQPQGSKPEANQGALSGSKPTGSPIDRADADVFTELDQGQLEALKQQKQYVTLARYYERKYEAAGDPWDLLRASGHWRDAKRPDDALRTTDSLVQRKTGRGGRLEAAVYTTRAAAYRDKGDYQAAEHDIRKALAIEPQSPFAQRLLDGLRGNQRKKD